MTYTNSTDSALRLNSRAVTLADAKFRDWLGSFAGATPSVSAGPVDRIRPEATAPLLVNFGMRAPSHYLKILNRIVEFVAVLMMDYLFRRQRSTKRLLHNKSVFIDLAAIDVKDAMAIRIDPPISRAKVDQRITVPLESGIVHLTKTASKVNAPTVSHSAYFHKLKSSTKITTQSSYRSI